jgi:hypothetical protein
MRLKAELRELYDGLARRGRFIRPATFNEFSGGESCYEFVLHLLPRHAASTPVPRCTDPIAPGIVDTVGS